MSEKKDERPPAPDKFQIPEDGIVWTKPPETVARAKRNRARKILAKLHLKRKG